MENSERKIRKLGLLGIGAILVAALVLMFSSSQSPLYAEAPEKIDAEVYAALSGDDGSRDVGVFIMLNTAQYRTPEGRSMSVGTLKSQVASQREAFLDNMPDSEFQLTRDFETVPAVVGLVSSENALAMMEQDASVQRVSLDNSGGAGHLAQSIPLVGADVSFNNGFTGEGITVAVLDSGIDSDHPSLNQIAITDEICFLQGTSNPCPDGSVFQEGVGSAEDDFGHGTFVTGVIASNDTGPSSRGMAEDIDLVAVKVLDANNAFATSSEIVAALDYVFTDHPEVQIINMSLGTGARFTSNCDNETSWTQALAFSADRLRDRGTLMFASSGNAGDATAMGAPACLGSVWAVGSSSKQDTFETYTDGDDQLRIVAPGGSLPGDLTAPDVGGGTRGWVGTSFAAPHVAGCAALLFESGLTADGVEARLLESDVQITNNLNGFTYPRLDCEIGDAPTPTATATVPAEVTPTATQPAPTATATQPAPTATVTQPAPTATATLPAPTATPPPSGGTIDELLDIATTLLVEVYFGTVEVPQYIYNLIRASLAQTVSYVPDPIGYLNTLIQYLQNAGFGAAVGEFSIEDIGNGTAAFQFGEDGSVTIVEQDPTAVSLQSTSVAPTVSVMLVLITFSVIALGTLSLRKRA